MLATKFKAESGHNNLPWASVLGAGGGVLVTFTAVRVAGGAVVLAAVVFGGVAVAPVLGVAVGAVVFGPVVLVVGVVPVFLAVVAVAVLGAAGGAAGFEAVVAEVVPADMTDEAGPVDAAVLVDAATGAPADSAVELPASTPVSVGVGEPLTSAARPALPLPAAAFDRPATTKTTPISTATAATIRTTRRSQ